MILQGWREMMYRIKAEELKSTWVVGDAHSTRHNSRSVENLEMMPRLSLETGEETTISIDTKNPS